MKGLYLMRTQNKTGTRQRSLAIVGGKAATEGSLHEKALEHRDESQPPAKPASVAKRKVLSAVWDEVVPKLWRAGLLTDADTQTIEMMLRHFALARIASNKILDDESLLTVWNERQQFDQKGPLEVIFRQESDSYIKYADKLGMTLMSRAAVPLNNGGADATNPFMPKTGS